MRSCASSSGGRYRSSFLALATIAPTFSNDSMSATLNLMPSSSSAATMKLTYAKESQFGTSCRCVCIVSTTAPSESRSPRMRPNTSKSSSSVMLGRLPGDVGSNGDVLLQIEHPPCRTLGQRCHIVYFGESQIWIEAADYAIL